MPDIDCGYGQDATLEIKAYLARGWRRLKPTYGFSEQEQFDFLGGWRIRCQLTAFARPKTLGQSMDRFPEAFKDIGEAQGFSYTLDDGVLTLLVDLCRRMAKEGAWLANAGKPGFFDQHSITIGAGIYLEVNLLVVLTSPPMTEPTDIYEYDTQFWQGGLPGLGRRRRH